MCITVLDEKPDCVLLALACSDGALRFVKVSLLWKEFFDKSAVK